MKVIDVIYVTGRGFVFLLDVNDPTIKVGDKLKVEDAEFEIKGVERMPYMSHMAVIPSPNASAYTTIYPGDEVEIVRV